MADNTLKALVGNLMRPRVLTIDEQNEYSKREAQKSQSAFDTIGPQDEEQQSIILSDRTKKTFDKRDVTVNPQNYEASKDYRAQNVSAGHKWANGAIKFVGKTATAVAGATLGAVYGLGAAVKQGKFSGLYDNDFQHALDNANEWMDDTFRHYYTREEQKANFWKSVTKANFWANDVLGAMSFTAGAIISGTIGLGAVGLVAKGMRSIGAVQKGLKMKKTLDLMAREKEILKGFNTARKAVQKAQTGQKIANIATSAVMGAGYEAGVEARHFKEETLTQYIENFERINGRKPTQEELINIEKGVNSVGNFVFALNFALVGGSNIVQFKNIFWKKPKPKLKVDITPQADKEAFKNLTGKAIAKTEIPKTKLQKAGDVTRKGWAIIQNPLMEGVVEEGGQSVFAKTGSDYILSKYNYDGTENAVNIFSSMAQGLQETYGTSEGMKEVMMGVLIGAIGMPGLSGSWKPGIMQGLSDYNTKKGLNKEISESQAYFFNEVSFDNVQNQIRAHAAQVVANNTESTNMFEQEMSQVDGTYAFLENRDKLGLLSQTEKEFEEYINSMSNEEFATEFGYTDVATEKLEASKQKAIRDFKQTVENIREARKTTEGLTEIEEVNDALAFNIHRLKHIDQKSEDVLMELSDIIGQTQAQTTGLYIKFNAKLGGLTSSKNRLTREVKALQNKIDELEKNHKKLTELEKQTITNSKKDIAELDKAIKEKERLIKEFKTKSKALGKNKTEYKGYDFDLATINEFLENLDNIFKAKEIIDKEQENPVNAEKINELLTKLTDYERHRRDVIFNYNHLLSEMGQKKLKDLQDVEMMKFLEDSKLFQSVDETLEEQEVRNLLSMYKVQKLQTMSEEAVKMWMDRIEAKLKGEEPESVASATTTSKQAEDFEAAHSKTPGVNFTPALSSHANITRIFNISPEMQAWLESTAKGNIVSKALVLRKIDSYIHPKTKETENFDKEFPTEQDPTITVKSGLAHENKGLVAYLDLSLLPQELIDKLPSSIEATDDNLIELGAMLDPRRFRKNGIPLELNQVTVLASLNKDAFVHSDNSLTEVGQELADQYTALVNIFEEYIDGKTNEELQSEENLAALRDFLHIKNNTWYKPLSLPVGERPSIESLYPPEQFSVDMPEGYEDFEGKKKTIEKGIYIVDKKYTRAFIITPDGQSRQLESPTRIENFMKSTHVNARKDTTLADIHEREDLSQYSAVIMVGGYPRLVSVGFPSVQEKANGSTSVNEAIQRAIAKMTPDEEGKILDESPTISEPLLDENDPISMTAPIDPKDKLKADFRVFTKIEGKEIPGGLLKLDWYFKPSEWVKGKRFSKYLSEIIQLKDPKTGELKTYIWTGNINKFYDNIKDATNRKKVDNQKRYEIMLNELEKGGSNITELTEELFHKKVADSFNFSVIGFFAYNNVLAKTGKSSWDELTEEEKDLVKSTYFDNHKIRIIKEVDKNEDLNGDNVGQMISNIKYETNVSIVASYKGQKRFIKKPEATTSSTPKEQGGQINVDSHINSIYNLFWTLKDPSTHTPELANTARKLIADLQNIEGGIEKLIEELTKKGITGEALTAALIGAHNDIHLTQTKKQEAPTQSPPQQQAGSQAPSGEKLDALGLEAKLTTVQKNQLKSRQSENPINLVVRIVDNFLKEHGFENYEHYQKVLAEQIGNTQTDNKTDSVNDDSSAPFSFNALNDPLQEESIDEAIEQLKQILPIKTPENPNGIITVEEFKIFTDKVKGNQLPIGRVIGSAIQLAKLRTKGTKFHEAFHIVFRTFLSDSEINKVLNEAKKKWKHTKEDISELEKTLIDFGVDLSRMSKKDILDLWYEEKLAEEFEKKKPMSWLGKTLLKLFRRIRNWIESFFGKSDLIRDLFEDIHLGKYKFAKPVHNVYSSNNVHNPNKLIKITTKDLQGRTEIRILPKKISKLLIDELTVSILKNSNKIDFSQDLFNKLVNELKDKYSPANYEHLNYQGKEDAFFKFLADLSEIELALTNKDALEAIKKEVNLKLMVFNIKETEYDEIEQFLEQLENETSTEGWMKESYQIGGYMNLSRRMRTYISTTETVMDKFGLGQDFIEQDPKIFKSVVDGFEVYSGIERALAGSIRSELWKKFEAFSSPTYNPQSYALKERILDDILEQNNIPQERKEAVRKDLKEGKYYKYKKSPVLADFLASFHKVKAQFYFTRYDTKNFLVDEFNSNSRDVDVHQFEAWSQNYRMIGVSKEKMHSVMGKIEDALVNPNNEPLESTVREIKDLFSSIGIQISEGYITFSLVHEIKAQERNYPHGTPQEKIKEYEEFYDAYKYVITPIAYKTKNVGKMRATNVVRNKALLSTTPLGPYSKEVKDVGKVDKDETGAVNVFMEWARNNAMFDESVGSSVFRNAEDKLVFDKIHPSFLTEMLLLFKQHSEEISEFENWKDLKKFLKSKDRLISDYQIKKLWRFWEGSNILKDYTALSNLEYVFHDGLAERILEYNQDELGYHENNFLGRKTGNAYKKLSPEEAEIYSMILFDNYDRANTVNKSVGGQRFAFFQIGVLESKSTAISVKMPVYNYFDYGTRKLTQKGKEDLFNSLNTEFERIKEVIAEGKNAEEYDPAYHDNRGTKLFMFKNIPGAEIIEKAAEEGKNLEDLVINLNDKAYTIPELLDLHANNLLDEYFETLTDVGLINKTENGYRTDFLPVGFRKKDPKTITPKNPLGKVIMMREADKYENIQNVPTREVDEAELSNFFFNDYFNTTGINMLLHGDMAMSYKNYEDVVKRNGGLVASGPALSLDSSPVRVAGLTSIQAEMEVFNSYLGHTEKQGLDKTDAQSIGTVKYLRRMFEALGKMAEDPPIINKRTGEVIEQLSVAKILTKIERGLPITKEENKHLEFNNATLQPKKIVQRDFYSYIKTSLHTLTREMVSEFTDDYLIYDSKTKKYKPNEEKINKVWDNGDITEIILMYQAKPGKELLHNMMNKMLQEDIDLVVFDSAMKMFKPNILETQTEAEIEEGEGNVSENILDNLKAKNIREIAGDTFKEQLITDGFKTKVVDGTQKLQLVWSEQGGNQPLDKVKVVIDGIERNLLDVQTTYTKTIANRVQLVYNILEESIFEVTTAKDGTRTFEAKWSELLEVFQRNLNASNADPYIFELFSENLKGEMKYNLNFPAIRSKFMQMYLNHISSPLAHKASGRKYSLVSDIGYLYQEKDSDSNPIGQPRRLAWGKKDENGNYYAEVVVSEKVLEKFKLSLGEIIDSNNPRHKKLLKQLGVRIPTQDKHSMVTLKIVETTPAYMGNMIIMPHEVIKLSGADFDIDALYARTYTTFGRGNLYGDYILQEDEGKALKEAYIEYLYYKKENDPKVKKRYAEIIKVRAEEQKRRIAKAVAVAFGKKEDDEQTLQSYIGYINEILNQKEPSDIFSEEEDETLEADEYFVSGETRAIVRRIVEAEGLHPDANVEEVIDERVRVLKKLKRKTLEKDTPELLEEAVGMSLSNFSAKYKEIVKNNIKAYRAGQMSKVTPITVGEADNILLDHEIVLSHNDANHEIAITPSSMDIFKKYLFERVYSVIGLTKGDTLTDINTRTSKLKARESNLVGAFNIGPAALFNVLYQQIINTPGITSFIGDFNINAKLREKESLEIRMNDIISTVVSIMTDNAKEQIAAELNISIEAVTPLLVAISTGIPFTNVMLMMKQDALKRINIAYGLRKNRVIKSDKLKGKLDDLDILNIVLQENYDQDLKLPLAKGSGEELKPIELTEDILIKAIQINERLRKKEEVSEEDKKLWKDVQMSTIHEYSKFKIVAEDLRAFQRILSLIKGFPSDWGSFTLKEDLDKLGLYLDKNDNNRPNDYVIVQAYLDEDKTDPKNESKIDFGKILHKDNYLTKEIAVAAFLEDKSDLFFVEKTNIFQRIRNRVLEVMEEGYTDYKDNDEKLTKHLLSFLTLRASVALKAKTKRPNDIEFYPHISQNSSLLFDSEGNPRIEKQNNLELLKDEVGNLPEHRDNFFLQNTKARSFQYSAKHKGQDAPLLFHSIEADNWSKKDYDYNEKMMYGFAKLLKAGKENPGGPEDRFVQAVLLYLYGPNALMFKSGSFITQIEPQVLLTPNKALTAVHEYMKEKGGFFTFNGIHEQATVENIFGQSLEELIDEFMQLYVRFPENATNVRGNSIRNLKQSNKTGKGALVRKNNKNVYPIVFLENKSRTFPNEEYTAEGIMTLYIDLSSGVTPSDTESVRTGTKEKNEDIVASSYLFPIKKNKPKFKRFTRVGKHILRLEEAFPLIKLDNNEWVRLKIDFVRNTYTVYTSNSPASTQRENQAWTIDPSRTGSLESNNELALKAKKLINSGSLGNVIYRSVDEIGKRFIMPYAYKIEEIEDFYAEAYNNYKTAIEKRTESERLAIEEARKEGLLKEKVQELSVNKAVGVNEDGSIKTEFQSNLESLSLSDAIGNILGSANNPNAVGISSKSTETPIQENPQSEKPGKEGIPTLPENSKLLQMFRKMKEEQKKNKDLDKPCE